MIIGSANLNYGRGWKAHRADIRALLAVADVVCLQELRRPIRDAFRRLAHIIQPRRNRFETGSEGIVVKRGVKVLRRGSKRAYLCRYGFAIGWRRIVWSLIPLEDGTPVLTVDYHRVPLRMQGTRLSAEQDARVRDLLDWAENEGWEWVVIGDMNQLERADPARLARDFHARWVGSRIDLAAVSPRLRVVDWHEIPQPHRDDNHPFLFVQIERRHP